VVDMSYIPTDERTISITVPEIPVVPKVPSIWEILEKYKWYIIGSAIAIAGLYIIYRLTR